MNLIHHPKGFALDVSNNNPATEAQVKASGAEILICKAVEGTVFKDTTLAKHRAIAKKLGIAFGSYTFLHPDSKGSEAKFYLDYAAPKPGDVQPIVDAETFSGVFRKKTGIAALGLRAASCAGALKNAGFNPIIYAGPYSWPEMVKAAPHLKQYKVWEAQYPGPSAWSSEVAHLRMRIAGAHIVMWQFTDKHLVQGKGFDYSRVMVPVESLLTRSRWRGNE